MRGIMPVTGERHGQCGGHIQREYPGIHLHGARILVTGQCLNNFPGLAVIERVHDIAVPECMRCNRNLKMDPVSFGPLHGLLQPVTHGFIGNGP